MYPNIPESKFIELCEKYHLPYDYVGDGKVIINGCIPDFINSNGKKEVILIHGIYWHLRRPKNKGRENITRKLVEKEDKLKYEKHGFVCKIIWEDELNDENLVLDKIR